MPNFSVFKNPSNIAVTGANGFIGSHIISELRRKYPNHSVFGLVRKGSESNQTLITDLTNSQNLKKTLRRLRPKVIFHTAGISEGNAKELWESNVLTTVHLIEAITSVDRNVRVVLLGSAAEYGHTRQPSSKNTRLNPLTTYAWTKCCQSLFAQMSVHQGLNIVEARLFNLIGPGLPKNYVAGTIAYQIAKAEKRGYRDLHVGKLSSKRDFMDVRDAAKAIIKIGEVGNKGRAYNICSGKAISIQTLLKKFISLAHCKLIIRTNPEGIKRYDIPLSVGNPKELMLLGWKPAISEEASLKDTLEYYRNIIT